MPVDAIHDRGRGGRQHGRRAVSDEEQCDRRERDPGRVEAGYGFGSGVNLDGSNGGASGNVVEGNIIGTDATGTQPLGNLLDGVHIQDGASGNSIGGTVAGAGNVIAFNDANGVAIGKNASDDSNGDAVLRNAIYANAGIGIDLGDEGPTVNGPRRVRSQPAPGLPGDLGGGDPSGSTTIVFLCPGRQHHNRRSFFRKPDRPTRSRQPWARDS